jgi:tetratricopeptide (TPR) repeat protein
MMINIRRRQLSLVIIALSFLSLSPLLYRSWNRFRLVDVFGFVIMFSYGIWLFVASGRHRLPGTISAPPDTSDLIKALTKKLALERNDRAELLHQRALLQISQQEWEAAVDDFTAALESAPENLREADKLIELYHYRGTALTRRGRFKEALQDLSVAIKWIETYPEKAGTVALGETLAERADCYLAEGDNTLAQSDLRKAIPLLEGDYLVNSRIQLGAILVDDSRWQDALDEYDIALTLVSTASEDLPWRAGIQYARGRILSEMNRFEDATKLLDEAITIMASDEEFADGLKDALLTRADALLHCGELTKSASDVALVLQKSPGDFHARVIRALIATEKQQFREAMEELHDVIVQQPDYLPALQNYAVLLTGAHDDSLRNGARALEVAEKLASQMGRQHWIPLSAQAAAHAELGDFQKAVELAAQSLEAAPEDQKAGRTRRLEQFRQRRPFRCEPLSAHRQQAARSQ